MLRGISLLAFLVTFDLAIIALAPTPFLAIRQTILSSERRN